MREGYISPRRRKRLNVDSRKMMRYTSNIAPDDTMEKKTCINNRPASPPAPALAALRVPAWSAPRSAASLLHPSALPSIPSPHSGASMDAMFS